MKIKIIVIAIAIFIGLPSVVAGSSIVSSLIQGKSPMEAIEILANQIDNLLGRVTSLENSQVEQNIEIEKLRLENENLKLQSENIKAEAKAMADKQECETLAEKGASNPGPYGLWGSTPTITSLYLKAQDLLDGDPYLDSNESRDRLKIEVRKVYEEAKPLYEVYVAKCGNN